jgi:tetratricopeptide repeat protein 21B
LSFLYFIGRTLYSHTHTCALQVLNAYILIAARTKISVEEGVNRLTAMLETDPDYAPSLQALATAYMVQKQSPKARNLVKRMQKLPFDTELTDHWVQAHLLMSDIQIESGKYDQAVDALNAVLALDSSCARAYEYLGAIAEREVRYAEAAELYERAWKYENESSAPVGFKLAFNYLKAGRYVSAIDVCHKILKQFPDYPKIKSDVLDKARALLRA